ncbi:MAG: adenylate/guanylate cyclase domain-containing protein [Pseudomonadales bacterium]|nr:adenylate/guanylate cyclase domain-containing protein [Pseudomonadales bacterium]
MKSYVGLLFADLVGSTRLYEQLGDAQAHKLVSRALSGFCREVERHHGRVVKQLGDGIFGCFSLASDAATASLAMHHWLSQESWGDQRLTLRAGLHAGDVLQNETGDLFGDAVNVTARLCEFAQPGQLLCSEALVLGLKPSNWPLHARPPLQVRGRQQPVLVYELLTTTDDRTLLMPGLTDQPPQPVLELQLADQRKALACGDSFTLGRADNCDWVVHGQRISRHHARIESRLGQFLLVDYSSNGTLIQTDTGTETLLHGASWLMQGQGRLFLGGQKIPDSRSLHFYVRQPHP